MKSLAIVTGATACRGLEVSLELLRRGYMLAMADGSETKASIAASELNSQIPGADVDTALLDVSSLASVNDFTDWCMQRFDRLDLLINNVGITGMRQIRDPGCQDYLPRRQTRLSMVPNILESSTRSGSIRTAT